MTTRAHPEISVCIPTYRGAAYIEECLFSVATQTGVAVQIIICDDQSNDDTLKIAKYFAASHPHVDWIIRENTTRLGMVENWNQCVTFADGKYLKIMGQDDILFSGCLAQQSDALESHPSASLVAARRCIINSVGTKILNAPAPFSRGLIPGRSAAIRCLLSATNTIGDPVALLCRTRMLRAAGGFNLHIRYCTDVAMIMNLLALGDFFFDPSPRVGYRVHQNAVGSASQEIVVSEFLQCLTLAEGLFGMRFTEQTRLLIAFRSKVLSLIRRRLYNRLNAWPFMFRPPSTTRGLRNSF